MKKTVAMALLCGIAAMGACNSSSPARTPGGKTEAAKAGDTAARVTRIVAFYFGVDAARVTPEARFRDDLGADSLDIIELVMAFEEEFGVEVTDEAADKMVTVGDAIAWLDGHKA